MEDMKTRHREIYLSFLRLDKLKKMTTTKNNDTISSDQKKEIQEETRRVELLLKKYDSLWTEKAWRLLLNISLGLPVKNCSMLHAKRTLEKKKLWKTFQTASLEIQQSSHNFVEAS